MVETLIFHHIEIAVLMFSLAQKFILSGSMQRICLHLDWLSLYAVDRNMVGAIHITGL